MSLKSILDFAHQLVKERVSSGDKVVDATIGNGIDTLFLTRLVEPNGTIYGCDIQPRALEQTARRLAEENHRMISNVQLHLQSHAVLLNMIPLIDHGQIGAVMFNLGYLPGSDRQVTTQLETTISALDHALQLLRVGGIITVIVYPGHPGGREEGAGVIVWASQLLQQQYNVYQYGSLNQQNNPSFLIAIEKRYD